MQDEQRAILVKNWLYKADEAIKTALVNVDNDCLSGAQNRIYYAVFYAVMALGQQRGFVTSKHTQLMGWFNRELVKTGKMDVKYGKFYNRCYNTRQKSDYTTAFMPSREALLEDIEKAREFVELIKSFM